MLVIKVENLGKKYLIGHDRKAGGTFHDNSLRDSISHSIKGIYQRIRHPLSPNREKTELEEFWALKNINFEIQQGEKVGIIGRNGAGKSTLLKVLSRITDPTKGTIRIKGRIASLLEVGTGFHPELTGRENIFLNGAILGMKRQEIKRKFEEIVDFSGVEKFLDTPVKRYSSGMYVRLAFSVAAHLEPEILLIDEVLAVGDTEFQRKCLGKMDDISKHGRTIIFVSHNMGAISELTGRAIYLRQGKIFQDGPPEMIIETYLKEMVDVNKSLFPQPLSGIKARIIDIRVSSESNVIYGFNAPLEFIVKIDSDVKVQVDSRMNVRNSLGHRLITIRNFLELKERLNEFKIIVMDHYLPPGTYILSLGLKVEKRWVYTNPDCSNFSISDVEIKDELLLEKQDKLGLYLPSIVQRD